VPYEVAWLTGALLLVGFTQAATALAALPLLGSLDASQVGLHLAVQAAAGAAFLLAARAAWLGQLWARWAAVAGAAALAVSTFLNTGLTATGLGQLANTDATVGDLTRGTTFWLETGLWWLVVAAAIVCTCRPTWRTYAATRQQAPQAGGLPPLPGALLPRPSLVIVMGVLYLVSAGASAMQAVQAVLPKGGGSLAASGVFSAAVAAAVLMRLLQAGFAVLLGVCLLRGQPWAWAAMLLQLVPALVAAAGLLDRSTPATIAFVITLPLFAVFVALLAAKSVRAWLFGPSRVQPPQAQMNLPQL
jgi:hypothetical protein